MFDTLAWKKCLTLFAPEKFFDMCSQPVPGCSKYFSSLQKFQLKKKGAHSESFSFQDKNPRKGLGGSTNHKFYVLYKKNTARSAEGKFSRSLEEIAFSLKLGVKMFDKSLKTRKKCLTKVSSNICAKRFLP